MDCRRYVIVIASLTLFIHASLSSLDYELQEEDQSIRKALLASIREPGLLGQGCSYLASAAGYCTPNLLKSALDHSGAFLINSAGHSQITRNALKNIFFGKENKIYAQYNAIIGVHNTIPDLPIIEATIVNLIEEAKKERGAWANGRKSGAVYDGSEQHMEDLADFFRQAIDRDELNQGLFANDEGAKKIAVEAFKHFQTSNPLHGDAFPLSVKAMRELSSMLANLVGRNHAIPSSSGQEALRLGLRALKSLACPSRSDCSILAIDDQDRIARANQTLNINTISSASITLNQLSNGADAAVFYLSKNNKKPLNEVLQMAKDQRLYLHIHVAQDIFIELLPNEQLSQWNLFDLSPQLVSISFDTEGLLYNGISATIFADAQKRFNAIEAHIDWQGGIYPAINSAGSISGIDYIIAYLITLYKGRSKLKEISRVVINKPFQGVHPQLINDSEPAPDFSKGMEKNAIEKMLGSIQSSSPNLTRRDILEQKLVDTTLSIFNAAKEHYSGTITSGGTESIRLAVQAYGDRFTTQNKGKKPTILMSETAHIAFDRQGFDMDAVIIRVKNTPNKTMDIEDLKAKIIEHKANNIAAIITNLPSYSVGAYDDVPTISKIAKEYNIPLHVDSCLGAFVMQFIEGNPLAIDLKDPRFDGIISVSADLHKYGYTQKGLSFLAYRRSVIKQLPQEICQLRSSAHLEVGLACLLHVGRDGYQERAKKIVTVAKDLRRKLEQIRDLELISIPVDDKIPHFVIAFRLKDPLKFHTYTLASFMSKLGWDLSKVSDHTLHIALTLAHVHNENFISKFISDLSFAIKVLILYPDLTPSSSVGVYGMAANINGLSGHLSQKAFLMMMVKLYAENLMSSSS